MARKEPCLSFRNGKQQLACHLILAPDDDTFAAGNRKWVRIIRGIFTLVCGLAAKNADSDNKGTLRLRATVESPSILFLPIKTRNATRADPVFLCATAETLDYMG